MYGAVGAGSLNGTVPGMLSQKGREGGFVRKSTSLKAVTSWYHTYLCWAGLSKAPAPVLAQIHAGGVI